MVDRLLHHDVMSAREWSQVFEGSLSSVGEEKVKMIALSYNTHDLYPKVLIIQLLSLPQRSKLGVKDQDHVFKFAQLKLNKSST